MLPAEPAEAELATPGTAPARAANMPTWPAGEAVVTPGGAAGPARSPASTSPTAPTLETPVTPPARPTTAPTGRAAAELASRADGPVRASTVPTAQAGTGFANPGAAPSDPAASAPNPSKIELARAAQPGRLPLAVGAGLAIAVLAGAAWLMAGRTDAPPPVTAAQQAPLPSKVTPPGEAPVVPPPAATPVPAPGDAPLPSAPVVAAPAALAARGRLSAPPGAALILNNASKAAWTGCLITLPGRRQRQLPRLRASETVELPLTGFRVEPSAEALTGEVTVTCAEGVGRFRVR
jgi:hypothetical protein